MKHIFDWKEYARVARCAVAEGCVLIKNDQQVLPLKGGEKISIFGRSQLNYYKSGTGSGGMVNTPYVVSILDALREHSEVILNEELTQIYETWVETHPFDKGRGWANEPWCQEEMILTDDMIKQAVDHSDKAVVIIGRTAGEDKDNHATGGSYLLTEEEEDMLQKVCNHFDKVIILLNVGNIIDMSFVEKYNPQAVMYVWQGGMEGGHGVVDVLTGAVNPCGRLTDTIAKDINDYPSTKNFGNEESNIYAEDIYVGYRYFETAAKDKVVYPFGYGLSYTEFKHSFVKASEDNQKINLELDVTNVGTVAGKEVVQVYFEAPQGKLAKPLRNLVAFEKTNVIAPCGSQMVHVSFEKKNMASFDDTGATGHAFCYVLEPGVYKIYVGKNVREAECVWTWELDELTVTEELSEACAPVESFERMVLRVNEDGTVTEEKETVPTRKIDLKKRIEDNRETAKEYTGDKGYKFADVMNGTVSADDYLAQLTDEDLICMSRGQGMCPSRVTPGVAGAFGGVTESLRSYGMPLAACADGPSGIRMDCGTKAFSLPAGASLASSFNIPLIEELYEWEGMELLFNQIDTLLGPGMNIHRNPLNGRNFEYYSEDPYVTGKMAAAMLRGMHKYGVTGTAKHFAGNNQEFKRQVVDSVVSVRALREIYLKGFEIAVKEGGAYSIMTTYAPVNAIWTAGNYDLCTTILRKEWGFDGIVMTDWWARMNDDKGDDPTIKKTGYMVRAQNDLYMVVSDAASNPHEDDSQAALESGIITRGDLVRNAKNIIRVLCRVPAGKRVLGEAPEIEEINRPKVEEVPKRIMKPVEIIEDGYLDLEGFSTEAGSVNQFAISFPNKGAYTLQFKMKSDLSDISQSSMTVLVNNIPYKTITINGTNGEWITQEAEIESFVSVESYVDLSFAQNGIEIESIRVSRSGDLHKPLLS